MELARARADLDHGVMISPSTAACHLWIGWCSISSCDLLCRGEPRSVCSRMLGYDQALSLEVLSVGPMYAIHAFGKPQVQQSVPGDRTDRLRAWKLTELASQPSLVQSRKFRWLASARRRDKCFEVGMQKICYAQLLSANFLSHGTPNDSSPWSTPSRALRISPSSETRCG